MKSRCTFTNAQIYINTIILGLAACVSHFVYNLSGKKLIIGLFNPVSESVWEHLKLMFFPLLVWWIVLYFIRRNKCKIILNTWIESAAVSLVVAPLSVVLLFYSYIGAFGIKSVFIDISLTFICYFIALSVAAHYLEYSVPDRSTAIVSIIVILIIFIAFIIFTINPPKLPIFQYNNSK